MKTIELDLSKIMFPPISGQATVDVFPVYHNYTGPVAVAFHARVTIDEGYVLLSREGRGPTPEAAEADATRRLQQFLESEFSDSEL